MRKTNIFENMENDIMNADINENEKSKLLKNVMRLKDNKINIMITGATGCGKSSTINALFDTEVIFFFDKKKHFSQFFFTNLSTFSLWKLL